MPTRWRSPPERPHAALAEARLEPVGECGDQASSCAVWTARRTRSGSISPSAIPERDVASERVVEQEDRLRHVADVASPRAPARGVERDPVDRHAPRRRGETTRRCCERGDEPIDPSIASAGRVVPYVLRHAPLQDVGQFAASLFSEPAGARRRQGAGGRVTVDGIALDAARWRTWRRHVATCRSRSSCSTTRFARNVALGIADGEIDPERVRAPSTRHSSTRWSRTPRRARGAPRERGVRLSGGERQRVGIARALYHDPTCSCSTRRPRRSTPSRRPQAGRRSAPCTAGRRCSSSPTGSRACADATASALVARGRVVDCAPWDELLARSGSSVASRSCGTAARRPDQNPLL